MDGGKTRTRYAPLGGVEGWEISGLASLSPRINRMRRWLPSYLVLAAGGVKTTGCRSFASIRRKSMNEGTHDTTEEPSDELAVTELDGLPNAVGHPDPETGDDGTLIPYVVDGGKVALSVQGEQADDSVMVVLTPEQWETVVSAVGGADE